MKIGDNIAWENGSLVWIKGEDNPVHWIRKGKIVDIETNGNLVVEESKHGRILSVNPDQVIKT